MNKPRRSIVLILVYFCLGHASCDLSTDNKSANSGSILEHPPFSTISDSIRQFPGNAGLYFRRAELLSKNNFRELALADYQRSWDLNPSEATGMRFASDLSIAGRPIEAINLLDSAVHRFPSNREFKRLLGDAMTQSGQIDKALELYQSLIKKDSSDFEAWYEIGILYERSRDTANAIRALEKSYAIQPVDTYALELAHIYAECKNADAVQICDDIIKRDSLRQWVDPFFIKGIYYSNKQQYNLAIVQFDSCIRRDWKFADAYIEKGIAFFKQKDYDKALRTFQLGSTVTNTNPDAYFWAGRCYEATAKKEEAILNYEKAISLDRNFREAKDALKRVKS